MDFSTNVEENNSDHSYDNIDSTTTQIFFSFTSAPPLTNLSYFSSNNLRSVCQFRKHEVLVTVEIKSPRYF